MNDSYLYLIVALLPLSACMVVFQTNPYHALVIRGILGAVAAMIYAVLGAPDVALTEALVGTMLAITLYAVAVRSSLVMRLGVLQDAAIQPDGDFGQLMDNLRKILGKHHLRLELVTYNDIQALRQGLMDKEVHATCFLEGRSQHDASEGEKPRYHTATRVRRIYDIMQSELLSAATILTHVTPTVKKEAADENTLISSSIEHL